MLASALRNRRYLIACFVVCVGCGGQTQVDEGNASDGGESEASTDALTDGSSLDGSAQDSAESDTAEPVFPDPPINGACVKISALPIPEGEEPNGRMLFSQPGELWLVSGGFPQTPGIGGTYRWTLASGWEHIELPESSAVIWPFAGVQTLATIDDHPAFGETTDLAKPQVQGWADQSCSARFFSASLGDPWMGKQNSCSLRRATAGLIYANTNIFRTFSVLPGESVPRVTDLGEGIQETQTLDGWIDDGNLWYLRYTAVGRWHVRSGRLTQPAVLDLDALRMSPLQGVSPISGYGAVAVREHTVWLYGADEGGWPLLAKVDPATSHAELLDATGLPRPGVANVEQDLLVHDGARLWKMRFTDGDVIVGTLDLETQEAELHPVTGDVDVARSLFIPPLNPVPGPGESGRELNGFTPPESLRALPLNDGEIVVVRQWGDFMGVRVSLTCS